MQFTENNLCYHGNKELPGLYILKLLAALMVIQIHIGTPLRFMVLPLCRIAVPAFFMISGYFLPDNHGDITRNRVGRSLSKILKITLLANAVYIGYQMLGCVLHPGMFACRFLNIKFWLQLFLVGNVASIHLWYLTAFLETYIVLWIMAGTKRFRLLYLFIPIGIALNLILGKYGFMFFESGFPTAVSRNFLTVGLPCVLTGILLRRHEHLVPNRHVVTVAMCVLAIALYTEYYLLLQTNARFSGDIVAFTLPLSVTVFLFFLRLNRMSGVFDVLSRWGRNYSTDIYLWHIMVQTLITKVILMMGMASIKGNRYIIFCSTIIVSFAVAMALRLCRRKISRQK